MENFSSSSRNETDRINASSAKYGTKTNRFDELFRHVKKSKTNEKIAFVFSGGGNRGAAQIGMLKALVEHNIMPDIILGASVGALNGVAFASKPDLDTIENLNQLWLGLKKEDIFPPQRFGTTWRYAQRRAHVYPNAKLRELISQNITVNDLGETKIPVEVVLTRKRDGRAVRIGSGDALSALLASTALPGTFPGVQIGTEIYIDGGVADDVPIHRAVQLGATTIYVLLCGTLETKNKSFERPIEAVLDSFSLAKLSRLRAELETFHDTAKIVVLQSSLAQGIPWLDFSRSDDVINDSYASARAQLDMDQASFYHKLVLSRVDRTAHSLAHIA